MIPITGPVRMTVRPAAADERIQWNKTRHISAESLREEDTLWLAYQEDVLCGGMVLEKTDTSCEIRWLYVDPDFRGLGAAYLLTEQAAAAAGTLPVTVWVPLENTPAQRFFSRFGFAPDGQNRIAAHPEGMLHDGLEVRYTLPADALRLTETRLDVPYMDQREKYPTGCESVSTVMALQYAGVEIAVETWIDRYLPKGALPHTENGILVGANPWKAFPGDPYSAEGWGCFVPVIEKAAEDALAGTGFRVKPLYNLPFAALCRLYVSRGIPVILWATLDMAEGRPCTPWQMDDGTGEYTWTEPMHCLLLTGFDGEKVYCNDPMRGKDTAYPWDKAEKAYHTMHTQAAVVLPEIGAMEHAHSAGAVLYTLRDGEIRYLLVREKLGHTGFPKGHLEAGETVYDAALREIREETGLHALLETEFRKELVYALRNGEKWKRVTYFAARYNGDEPILHTGEVAEVMELPYDAAMETLTYENARELLQMADRWIRGRN